VRSIDAATQFPAYVLAHWLPEGLRVSLHKYADRRILVVNLETEDSISVPVDGNYTWLEEGAWSPDGRRFAVSTQSTQPPRWTIRTVTLDGNTETVIEDTVPIGTPRWAPDGTTLYFARSGEAIERVALDGRQTGGAQLVQAHLEALAGGGGTTGRLSLTHDGRHVAYVRGAPFSNLRMIEIGDAGQLTDTNSLTTGTALRWSPVVSPDGRWIAFGQQEHGAGELARMPIGGSTVTVITQRAGANPHSRIAWSPTGEELAFTSARPGGHQVIVANVRTGRLRPFPRTSVSDGRHNLAWGPGAAIAYQRAGNRSIHLLDPASGADRPLVTDTAGFFHGPQYSPDGRRLAVTWNRGAKDQSIWVFGVDDSSRRRVQDSAYTGTTTGGPYAIGWSPDGRYIYAMAGAPLLRVDTRIPSPPDTVALRSFGEGRCTPAGRLRPRAFVCAVSDVTSDVWMIENFDPSHR
jgi:Tol biopolymer transport system component